MPLPIRLDFAARVLTCSSSFRDLVAGCRPFTSYTPTLRPNAYRHGSTEERECLRLRRALHACGVDVYPAFGWLDCEPAPRLSALVAFSCPSCGWYGKRRACPICSAPTVRSVRS